MKDMLPTTLILNAIRRNPSLVEQYIKSRLLYTIDIEPLIWSTRDTMNKLLNNGVMGIDMSKPKEDTSIDISIDVNSWSEFVDVIWFKNIPIIFHKKRLDSNSDHYSMSYRLITINSKSFREKLNKFVDLLYNNGPKLEKRTHYKSINIVRGYDADNVQSRLIPLDDKTFDDVFIPDEQYNALINGIDNFMKNRKFLEEHKIPTHFGILLYGTPGCGRTSIIKALIRNYNAISYYLPSLDTLPGTIKSFISRMNNPDELSFVICEDVDCTLFNRQKEYKKKNDDNDRNAHLMEKVSLAEVLNSIDGICSPNNTIFIFTTNHIEELDPALIRPGRMDLRLEIKPICYETLNKFTGRYFNKELPEDYICKEGELFSTLQLMVMGGASFEDILNYMKGA